MNKFNLSLDDFSPHPRAGIDFESIKWCDKIIEKYPSFKVNLFVPGAYCRLGENPCYLVGQHDWLDKVKQLSPNNYRINFHGYHHRRTGSKHPNSNNDEFQYLNEQEADDIITLMLNEFDMAALNYTMTFRPPGWKISKEAVKKLAYWGFSCLAGSKEWEKTKGDTDIKWVNYNWDLLAAPPQEGNVIAYGHTSNWTTNFLNEERYNTIINFLQDKQFEFCFIEEV